MPVENGTNSAFSPLFITHECGQVSAIRSKTVTTTTTNREEEEEEDDESIETSSVVASSEE